MAASLGVNSNNATEASTPLQDARVGWRLLRIRKASNETTITDLNDAPADKVAVPLGCRFALVRGLCDTASKACTVELYGWPVDPGTGTGATQNDSDGNAAGWLIGSYTLTSTAKTADSLDDTAEAGTFPADRKVTNIESVDLAGAAYIATRSTNVAADAIETVVRFY